jgi:aminoglycoside 3-N-acetyltransferase
MVTYRELLVALRGLEIDPNRPIIAHASLSAFGQVHGGAASVVGALLAAFHSVTMPTFTYKTMVTPEAGPADNAIIYGSGRDTNRMAGFFHLDMPADRLMGAIPEALRCHPRAQRSNHPILSFTGVNAAAVLEAQTIQEPLAPIQVLAESGGWVVLLGVDYTVNTSIHYAERCAGRKQFVRWALTPQGVCECPGFPGCSDGFPALAARLQGQTRTTQAGEAEIQAIPLTDLVEAVCLWIRDDPLALLCERKYCERCCAVRAAALARL